MREISLKKIKNSIFVELLEFHEKLYEKKKRNKY